MVFLPIGSESLMAIHYSTGPLDKGAKPLMQNGTAIKITALKKNYDNGFKALNGIDLEISRGEIFALLGPNGAGKTTLISTVCGIVRPTSGTVAIGGYDNILQY